VPLSERAKHHERYDRYLTDELFPYVRARASQAARCRGLRLQSRRLSCSQRRGPAFRLVAKAVCLSGVYDVPRFLDCYWDLIAYCNSPIAYIANIGEGWITRLCRIDRVIARGEYVALAEDNRRFDAVLLQKCIPRHGRIWQGGYGHDWAHWNAAARRLL
jgi:esterase/lipase superfamily enzyme